MISYLRLQIIPNILIIKKILLLIRNKLKFDAICREVNADFWRLKTTCNKRGNNSVGHLPGGRLSEEELTARAGPCSDDPSDE